MKPIKIGLYLFIVIFIAGCQAISEDVISNKLIFEERNFLENANLKGKVKSIEGLVYTYDEEGNKQFVEQSTHHFDFPLKVDHYIEFDFNGNPTKSFYYNRENDSLVLSKQFTYDKYDNPLEIISYSRFKEKGSSYKSNYKYDYKKRVVTKTTEVEPSNNAKHYFETEVVKFNKSGSPIQINKTFSKDSTKQILTKLKYNSNNQLVNKNSNLRDHEFFYDKNGNLIKEITITRSRKTITKTYEYDENNNILVETINNDRIPDFFTESSYTYDSSGNLKEHLQRKVSKTSFAEKVTQGEILKTYNKNGDLLQTNHKVFMKDDLKGPSLGSPIKYTYDEQGNWIEYHWKTFDTGTSFTIERLIKYYE